MSEPPEHSSIQVTVAFAAATHPYRHTYDRSTVAATVQADAMLAFEITTDGTDRYFLVHDGGEVPPDKTIGQLADKAHDLHLALRTETISG
jgi:hypothetical protein